MPVSRLLHCLCALLVLLQSPLAAADTLTGRGLKPDLRLLIDISGSMKASDPDNLREPALELIVRLLPDGARAGVWTFGERVEVLVPHGVVDGAWREQARRAVTRIDNSGQRTNIPAALAAASYDLSSMNPAYRSSIVLLTDGKVDVTASPMANANAARRLLEDTAPKLGDSGVPVHTIALSDEADWPFLRSLAERTTGIAERAVSADELTAVFVQSLEMVAPAARVPLADSSFKIDDSVEEFTALIFLGSGEAELRPVLLSPDGDRLDAGSATGNADWFLADRFVLATVREPQAGTWQLALPPGADARVTVIADLQLEVDPLPNSIPAARASELGIHLRSEGNIVRDPEVLELFDVSVDILGPEGTRQLIPVSLDYPLPETGEYRVRIPPFERGGRYELVARVRGETLERELPMYVEVIAAPEELSAISTRPANIPDADLVLPLMTLAATLLLLIIVAWWISRRRRKRRLATWRRRFEAFGEAVEDGVEDSVGEGVEDSVGEGRGFGKAAGEDGEVEILSGVSTASEREPRN